jgi:hypothetical protein
MWKHGNVALPLFDTIYSYWAKVYEEPSEFGIEGGKISKLTIRESGNSKDLYNFDRGLDRDCADAEVEIILNILLEKYN